MLSDLLIFTFDCTTQNLLFEIGTLVCKLLIVILLALHVITSSMNSDVDLNLIVQHKIILCMNN